MTNRDFDAEPDTLYHATTPRKIQKYNETGYIKSPVRGFTTLQGAMAWAISIEGKRQVFVEFETDEVHKLPDHHNKFGEAWWEDSKVHDYDCIWSCNQ